MPSETRRTNRTKIVATLGPASSSPERLRELFAAGLSVCRLNFSHGELSGHEQVLNTIRAVAAEQDRPIAVLGDLCGPKIRLQKTLGDNPFDLPTGQMISFARGNGECTPQRLYINYTRFLDEVDVGERIYIDDGLVRLLVLDRKADELVCQTKVGGKIQSRKGVNLPDSHLTLPALTDKDRVDAEWAASHGLEYLALSFARRPSDLQELRGLLAQLGSDIHVIVKIEKTEALEHIEQFVAEANGIMVARGDLGVEMDVWRVPIIQKELVNRCRLAGKPVIVATQMLQSMIDNPTPTRAEVSDVANAILDHADAVMLSAETATGSFPVLAVEMMSQIASATEVFMGDHRPPAPSMGRDEDLRITAAIANAAVQAATSLKAKLVATWSATGTTARFLSSHRLPVPIIGLTGDERVRRRMSLLHGVIPLRVEPLSNPVAMINVLDRRLQERGLVQYGDLIVVVTSTIPTVPKATNTVLVHRIGEKTVSYT